MSSWKRLPSAAKRNRRGYGFSYTPSKDKSDKLQHGEEIDNVEIIDSPTCQAGTSRRILEGAKSDLGSMGSKPCGI